MNEPNPLFLTAFLAGMIISFWLFLELVKFIFNPKQYLKRLLCFHYYVETSNDLWRLHDHKFVCKKCRKAIYRNHGQEPINKDF